MTSTKSLLCTILVAAIAVVTVPAQQNSQVSQILDKYKNWRYGMISVFRVNEDDGTITNLNMLLGPPEPVMPEEAKNCRVKDDLESYVLSGGEGVDEAEYQKMIRQPGCKAYERYYSQRVAWEKAQFKKAFLVTTRYQPGEPFTVIALLVQKNTESFYGLRQDLDPPSGKYLANELEAKELDEQVLVSGVAKKGKEILGTQSPTLLAYLRNQVIQGNMENVTPEAQGIGEEGVRFVKKTVGNTTGINEDASPLYMRITEGLPQDYQNENEIIVSALDGVSYRRFERPVSADGGEMDSALATNAFLPKYGVELKYGLEDINYPSIWSERLTLNAVWGASHLGVVLPTSGWSSLSTDLGAARKMTNGGMGINGAFDFPIRVISESGVFHVGASYVFSDAVQSDHMSFNDETNLNEDYLVRFHATMQYTFAVRIDDTFLFRMRLGGTVYNMESWAETRTDVDTALTYRKTTNETVGGLSGAVDFMATAWSTPVGFTLSYFDETILGKAWLQVPIMNQFAVRFDARVFAPVFRDPRAWENDSVVMPAVNFIFNF